MNSRERLIRCYHNQEVDRPAVYNRMGYPVNDPTYDKLKAYIEANTELKIHWNGEAFETPERTEYATEPYSEDFERVTAILYTPAGNLTSTKFKGLKGKPGVHETFLIKTREDVEKYLSLPVPEVNGDVSSFFAAKKEVGDRGIVDVYLGSNPGGFVAQLLGSENFAIMSLTDRDIIHALCERQMKIIMNDARYLLERNINGFFSTGGEEYIVPPLHGPKDFYDFNVKYDKPIIDLIHNAGGRFHIHCHGSIKKVLQGFIDMGVDVLHPFEAPPMGDVIASEAKSMVRGKICIEGNIQISHMYEHTPDQIREETKKLIRDAFDDHSGLIVCPTASAYIYGKGMDCFEQYRAMIETVLDYIG